MLLSLRQPRLLPVCLPAVCLGIALAVPHSAVAQTLKVTLLGTGTPPPIMERFGPSILVETDRVKPKPAVYSHIVLLGDPASPPPTPQDILTQTRKTYGGPLEMGRDLMVIEVGDTVTVRQATP